MSANTKKRIAWKDVMAALVTAFAILGFGGFITLIAMLLSNNSTSMSEIIWGRYVYLLAGIETITFTSIGWLFGKEVHREQAEMAQTQVSEAMGQTRDAQKETTVMVHDAMQQTKDAQKDTMAMAHDAMQQTKDTQKDTIAIMQNFMQMAMQAKNSQVAFIHIATSSNITRNYTDIDHPATNNRPEALILVTPNWSPGGQGDVYNDHSTGVWYHQGKWSIFNQDKTAMPVGAAFNVMVI